MMNVWLEPETKCLQMNLRLRSGSRRPLDVACYLALRHDNFMPNVTVVWSNHPAWLDENGRCFIGGNIDIS